MCVVVVKLVLGSEQGNASALKKYHLLRESGVTAGLTVPTRLEHREAVLAS